MLRKKRQQATLGELEAAGRVPQGHFLRQVDQKIEWQPFQAELEGLMKYLVNASGRFAEA